MGTPPTPQPGGGPPAPPAPTNDPMELLKFLSEESRKNREALRDETLAVRELFVKTSQIVAIPLTAAILLAGAFFYRNLDDMKKSADDTVETEAKLKIKEQGERIEKETQAKDLRTGRANGKAGSRTIQGGDNTTEPR